MATVLNTPPTIDSGVRKKTTGMLSCSKLLDHSPTMIPSSPNTADTLTTQNKKQQPGHEHARRQSKGPSAGCRRR